MPCTVEHMEPSDRERRLQHAATLQIYVRTKLSMEIPAWLTTEFNNAYASHDECETVLCAIMSELTTSRLEWLVYGNPKEPLCRELATWWEAHQEADRKRAVAEESARIKAGIKERALAKLTDDERKALGL